MNKIHKSKSLPFLFYRSKKNESKDISVGTNQTKKCKNDSINKDNNFKTKSKLDLYEKKQSHYERRYQSCTNLFNMRSKETLMVNSNNNKNKNYKQRPKSLYHLQEDLTPLLDTASSLSSIGSINNLTEESVLESSFSDESLTKDINIKRRGGKIRNIKHRPRSFAGIHEIQRSLCSIPENHNNNKTIVSIQNKTTSELFKNTLVKINSNIENSFNIEKGKTCIIKKEKNNNDTILVVSKDIDITIPRRRSKLSVPMTTRKTDDNDKSFSKEQKRRLKQKMKDTHKSPENSVFLGLF